MVTLSGQLCRLVPRIVLHNKPSKSVEEMHGHTAQRYPPPCSLPRSATFSPAAYSPIARAEKTWLLGALSISRNLKR
jgi:hypothetical protein